MNIFGFEISRKQHTFDLGVITRLLGFAETISQVVVTPETCMESPTVHAIVTMVSRRVSSLPIHVLRKSVKDGREVKEQMPSHPVALLLAEPNSRQTQVDYWQDAVSCFLRYGNFYAFKSRGVTGPIRELLPLDAAGVSVELNPNTLDGVTYRVGGDSREYPASKVHHVRGPARNFYKGDSPINDVKEAIALEIAAERFGASFFGNGAMPGLVLKFMQGQKGFNNTETEAKFMADLKEAYGGRKRFRSLLLPAGIDIGAQVPVENEKAQFLQTRQYQRTVIAGALGIPPHLVGDLNRATWDNVEQQSLDFITNVIQPIVQTFEAAMERDLLTREDRNSGVVIRFNLDGALRADFETRTEGNRKLREWGALSTNEWREREGMNPISAEDGGDDYLRPANTLVAGEPLPQAPNANPPK